MLELLAHLSVFLRRWTLQALIFGLVTLVVRPWVTVPFPWKDGFIPFVGAAGLHLGFWSAFALVNLARTAADPDR